jgi:hypothetical protein
MTCVALSRLLGCRATRYLAIVVTALAAAQFDDGNTKYQYSLTLCR